MKKLFTIILCFIIIISVAASSAATGDLTDTANYLIKTINNPSVCSVGGEWTIIGIARSGILAPDTYFEKYYNNVENYVKAKDGILHSRKNTEYSRVILALTAIGKNPENVAGYNLISPLLDFEKTTYQGINGAAWALIALDSKNYGTYEIRQKYISHILKCEKEGGGWALSESEDNADADITAMVLTALSKYRDLQEVNSAVERGIKVLSALQNDDGGYSSYSTSTSESAAQVLTAISALGISYRDTRFVKNGKTLVDNLISFLNSDGSFSHTAGSNLMATEQCFYALVSAKRSEEKKAALFDMNNASNDSGTEAFLKGRSPYIKESTNSESSFILFKNCTTIDTLYNLLKGAGLI